jgi:hypothetical protein
VLDPRLEVELDADAVGLLGRAQPQHVALIDRRLPLDAVGVDVEAPWGPRLVDDRLVEVGPDPRVDGAHAGKVDDEVAVGVGPDQDLGDDLVGAVAAAVQGAPEHGQRDEAQLVFGHVWLDSRNRHHRRSRYTRGAAAAWAAVRGTA